MNGSRRDLRPNDARAVATIVAPGATTTRKPAAARPVRPLSPLDLALAAALTVVALLLRLPYLHDVPRYTDEVREVAVALGIARGEVLRLTNFDSYMGSLANYLIAGAFLVFGEEARVPRTFMLAASAIAVGLTYLFGRSVGGRCVGVAAALLLAGNAHHIVTNSHFAYSHSLTPIFATLSLWLMWVGMGTSTPGPASSQGAGSGENSGDGRVLALAHSPNPRGVFLLGAFCFGLTLQTHPTAIALAPGIVVGLLLSPSRRSWLRDRRFWIAPVLVALGCANVIVYNVVNRGGGIAMGLAQREDYADGQSLGLERYPDHLLTAVVTLRELVQGIVAPSDPIPAALRWALLAIALGGLAIGIAQLWRWRRPLLPCVLASWVLVLPILTTYRTQLHRYWMSALPLICVLVALGLLHGSARLVRFQDGILESWWRRWPVAGATWLLLIALAAQSLPGLWEYYRVRSQVRPTNVEMERLAALVDDVARPGEKVLVDWRIFADRPPDESIEARVLTHLLLVLRRPFSTEEYWPQRIVEVLSEQPDRTFLLVTHDPLANATRRMVHAEAVPRSAKEELGLPLEILRIRAYPRGDQPPPDLDRRLDVVFGDQIRLIGYQIDRTTIRCGEDLHVRLYWQLVNPVAVDYTVFTHLIAGDQRITQHDGPPRDGLHPTSAWRPGEVVGDEYRLVLTPPCDASGGALPAQIQVGLYDRATMQRLPATAAPGLAGPDFAVLPDDVRIVP